MTYKKLKVGVLYLDVKIQQQWQWYKKYYKGCISWTLFMKVHYIYFECDTHHLGHLIELCQINTIMDYIVSFEQLAIHKKDQIDNIFRECFINGVKEVI